MLQNLAYFMYKKTQVVYSFLFSWINVGIDWGLYKKKLKNAGNEKQKNHTPLTAWQKNWLLRNVNNRQTNQKKILKIKILWKS